MPKTYSQTVKKGDRYGHWKVLRQAFIEPPPGKRRRHYSECRCMKCGKLEVVLTTSIVNGKSTQCQNCRYASHGDKVRTTPNGISVQIKISVNQRNLLQKKFGRGKCRIGAGVRTCIANYRKLLEPLKTLIPAGEIMIPTTISIDERDRDWLKANHTTIHQGIYAAINYHLNNNA